MISDSSIREQGYNFFLAEAPELLEQIEQDLLSLPEDKSTAKVHSMMRAAHTLKGSAANVELDLIQTIAHSLEDIFRSLYQPDLELTSELHSMMLEGAECLRTALTAEMTHSEINEEEIKQRTSEIFAKIQEELGDHADDKYIPSSVELGFDIAESIFQMGVRDRLSTLAEVLETGDSENIADTLRTQVEVFVGLAESLNLFGFKAIAETTLTALEKFPQKAHTIGKIALEDFQKGREAVLGGDREMGGEPSQSLQELAITGEIRQNKEDEQETFGTPTPDAVINLPPYVHELEQLKDFLSLEMQIPTPMQESYLKIVRCILGWFQQQEDLPPDELTLSLLIPQVQDSQKVVLYLQNWLLKFLQFIQGKKESKSLRLYRQGEILATLLVVAKFQYNSGNNGINNRVIQVLNKQGKKVIQAYKKLPTISNQEKQWFNKPKFTKISVEMPSIAAASTPQDEEELIEEIWGSPDVEPLSLEEQDSEVAEESVTETEVLEDSSLALNVPQDLATQKEPSGEIAPSDIEKEEAEVLETQPSKKTQQSKSPGFQPRQFVRVELEGLERLNHLSGELLINYNRQSLEESQLRQVVQKLLEHLESHQRTINDLREWSQLRSQELGIKPIKTSGDFSSFDTLELDQYSELHLRLHTALEDIVQLEEAAESIDVITKQASQTLEKQQRLLANVRNDLLEARMLPLGTILNRFTQMVERMATTYKKQVEFRVSGTDVLIDKAIAEKLYDPLLHLVRNAFDHGIESPEVRREQGKPETGLIEISAYYQGSQAIIEVRDDGKGLNIERIVQKANELELLPGKERLNALPASADNTEILDVLFEPGFSTASEVSEISGRGIGLDVVRAQLEALKGSVTVQSSPQRGTTFILQIPFSMTTAKLLVVQAGEAVYALLLETIERVLLPSMVQLKELEGKKVLHWNVGNEKAVISVRKLSDLVNYNSSVNANWQSTGLPSLPGQELSVADSKTQHPVCLVRSGNELMGLEVDAVLGDQEMVIRPLGNAIAPPKYVCGSSILGDGRLILVVDSAVLFRSGNPQPQTELLMSSISPSPHSLPESAPRSLPAAVKKNNPQPKAKSQPQRVMVIDDAVSLRQTLSLTLQKAGYQVIQAQDGLEALEKLQQTPNVNVILCDLEMPRMNGFEFLSHINQKPTLAKIPVVILTSRGAGKHRQLAKELGATDYFTKPYMEQDLLGKIAELSNGES